MRKTKNIKFAVREPLNGNVNGNGNPLMVKRLKVKRLFLVWIFLTHALDGVLDLADEEVYLETGLRLAGLQVGHHDVGKHLTKCCILAACFFLSVS